MSACVVGLYPRNEAVLREFLHQAPGVLYLPHGAAGTSPAFVAEAARRGTRVVELSSLVSPERCGVLHAEMSQRLASMLDAAPWNALARRHAAAGLDAGALRDIVGDASLMSLVRGRIAIEELNEAAKRDALELIVVNEDLLPISKARALWGRAHGVPVLQVAHSLILQSAFRTSHRELHSDALAVFGEAGRAPYREMGIADERLPITGNPAYDAFPALVADRDRIRAAVRARYRRGAGARLVLFATTAVVNHRAFIDPRYGERTLDAWFAARAVAQRVPDAFFVVKGRAVDDRASSEAAAALHGISPETWAFEDDGIDELIVAADAVVSVFSNVSVQAMLGGVPAIDLIGPPEWLLGPGFAEGDGVLSVSADELPGAIERVVTDSAFADSLRAAAHRRLEHYAGPRDGRAAHRVAALMHRMRKAPPAHPVQSGEAGEVDRLALVPSVPENVLLVPEDAVARDAAQRRWPAANVVMRPVEDPAAGLVDESIDAVILGDALPHVADPAALLACLRRLLAPRATLVAAVPNLRTLTKVQQLARGQVPGGGDGRNLFTFESFTRLFAAAGMTVLRVEREYEPALAGLRIDPATWPPGQLGKLDTEVVSLYGLGATDFLDLRTARFVVAAGPVRS